MTTTFFVVVVVAAAIKNVVLLPDTSWWSLVVVAAAVVIAMIVVSAVFPPPLWTLSDLIQKSVVRGWPPHQPSTNGCHFFYGCCCCCVYRSIPLRLLFDSIMTFSPTLIFAEAITLPPSLFFVITDLTPHHPCHPLFSTSTCHLFCVRCFCRTLSFSQR